MRNVEYTIEQTIGVEELFSLGGFIAETARKTLKTAWEQELPSVVSRLGGGGIDMLPLSILSKKISETIDEFNGDTGEENLYVMLMKIVEDFVEEYDINEALDDETIEEMHPVYED